MGNKPSAVLKKSIMSTIDHADLAFLLASCITRRREQLGLPIERAAQLAGMEVSEWRTLENGWVPSSDSGLLHAIAGALQSCHIQFSFIAEISRHNQELLFTDRISPN